MPYPASPTIAPLLAAVQARLVARTGLGAHLVKVVVRNQTPRFQGDQDLLLRPLRPYPEEGFVSGSGRVATVVQRPLLVTVRSRSQLDPSDSDGLWLTDTATGVLLLEDRVIDALHVWWPTALEGDPPGPGELILTTEPMRLSAGEPEVKPGAGAPQGDPQWGEARLIFEMKYLLDLDQSFVV